MEYLFIINWIILIILLIIVYNLRQEIKYIIPRDRNGRIISLKKFKKMKDGK